jgi:hypothetical protein
MFFRLFIIYIICFSRNNHFTDISENITDSSDNE